MRHPTEGQLRLLKTLARQPEHQPSGVEWRLLDGLKARGLVHADDGRAGTVRHLTQTGWYYLTERRFPRKGERLPNGAAWEKPWLESTDLLAPLDGTLPPACEALDRELFRSGHLTKYEAERAVLFMRGLVEVLGGGATFESGEEFMRYYPQTRAWPQVTIKIGASVLGVGFSSELRPARSSSQTWSTDGARTESRERDITVTLFLGDAGTSALRSNRRTRVRVEARYEEAAEIGLQYAATDPALPPRSVLPPRRSMREGRRRRVYTLEEIEHLKS